MAKLGVFGGTFDPPHLGHMILAAEAADQLGLDTVFWMVAPVPPHKMTKHVTDFERRVEMVGWAIQGEPLFAVSVVENERPGPHYTSDTFDILRRLYPDDELFFLIGQDSLNDLYSWHEPDRMISLIDGLGVMARPGQRSDPQHLFARFPSLESKLVWIDTPLLEISATDIRRRVRSGRQYRNFLSDGVWARILEWGLYRG